MLFLDQHWLHQVCLQIINRSGEAGAVLQASLWLIDWLTESPFSANPSKHHYTKTVRARELTFFENVHPHHVSHVRCQVSVVLCQVSHVRCHMSCVKKIHIFLLFSFFGQCGGVSRWRVCYQRGLPLLVFIFSCEEGC